MLKLCDRRFVFATMTVVLIAVTAVLGGRKNRGDLPVYMKAAERILAGEQIYRPDDPPAFTYPPFFALPFIPLLLVPDAAQGYVWSGLNLLLLFGITFLFYRTVTQAFARGRPPNSELDSPAIVWSLIGVLSTRLMISPVEYFAHDLLVVGSLLLGIRAWMRDRDASAGFWMGIATACKATPLLFLPVFVWQKKWIAVLAMTVSILVATLSVDAIVPSADGQYWCVAWYQRFVSRVSVAEAPDARGAWDKWNALNQSLPGTVYRLTTSVADNPDLKDVCIVPLSQRQTKWLTLALEAGVLLVVFLVIRRRCESAEQTEWTRIGQAGVVMCAMLLLSPMSSKHHFCTLLIPIAFLVHEWNEDRRNPWLWSALLCMFGLGTLGAKSIVGKAWGDYLQAFGGLTWTTTACMLGVTYCLTRSAKRRPNSQ